MTDPNTIQAKELTMSDKLILEEIDADGAIREGLDALEGDSRGDFFRRAAVAGGAFAGGGALLAAMPGLAQAAFTSGDVKILNFALTLEYLEAAFYTEAENSGALSGRTQNFATVVGAHERTHVQTLKSVLGSKAVAKPRFNFRGTTKNQAAFQKTAIILEDTGVSAYKGQAPLIASDTLLKAALSIHTVEARHAAWIRHIAGVAPAPRAFDKPRSMSAVLKAVAGTHFIVAKPAAQRRPTFTG